MENPSTSYCHLSHLSLDVFQLARTSRQGRHTPCTHTKVHPLLPPRGRQMASRAAKRQGHPPHSAWAQSAVPLSRFCRISTVYLS
jgi:hypothetical protein